MLDSKWPIGKSFSLGSHSFSKKEIIDYARDFDPLPFHLSEEAARKSRFNGLVCSGGQAFYYFYVNSWVPLFGETIEAGLGIDEWKFLAPIRMDEEIFAKCTLIESRLSKDPDFCINKWKFEFSTTHNKAELAQYLYLNVLHKNLKIDV